MSNLVPINQSQATGSLQITTMDDLSRLSKMLASSGYFADAKEAAQCGVKVLAALEIGVGAFAGMSGIHIIKGKPTLGANLMAAAVKRSKKYNYRVLQHTETICEIEFFEWWNQVWESAGISKFTLEDAKKAGTQNLDKFPRNMLFARAISNGVKWYCPDVFEGVTAYVPGELGEDYIDVDQPSTAKIIEQGTAFTGDDAVPDFISEAQRKRFWAIAKKAGWSEHTLKAMLLGVYELESSKSITTDIYEEFCAMCANPELAQAWADKLAEVAA